MPYEKIGDQEPVCIADEVPFEIPESWEWVRHNSIIEVSEGSQPPKSKFIISPKPGYVRLYQIRDYGKSPVPVYIPVSAATKTSEKGDILLARYGASLGKVFFAETGAYNVAMAKVIPLFTGKWIRREYLYIFYQSKLYQDVVLGNSRSAQAGFNKEDLRFKESSCGCRTFAAGVSGNLSKAFPVSVQSFPGFYVDFPVIR